MSAGQWIQQVTLGWLTYELTGSSVLLGALSGVRALPFLIASPLAGVAADVLDRRRLLLGIEAFLVVAALLMGLLVASGGLEVWHIFVFGFLTAVAWSFNQPTRQALVPMVVPKSDLMNAVALNSLGFNCTKVIGPALGGVLIAWIGAAGNFLLQAVAYGCVLVVVSLMVIPSVTRAARRLSIGSNFKEGMRYVRSSPTVLALIIANLIPNLFAMPYQALMPVFQKDVLGVGPGGLGLMLAAPGVGAVMAALLLASLSHRLTRRGPLLLAALFVLGGFLIAFSQTTTLPTALLMLVGVGGCHIMFAAGSNTVLQTIVPDELRGRVMSIYMLDHGLSPAGALLAGISTHYVGAPTTVAAMGVILIALTGVLVWRMPQFKDL
jgi:MFS family permease